MNSVKLPGFTGESSLPRIAIYTYAENDSAPPQSSASEVTPQVCTRRCRNVVRPELCFFLPFPLCLLPQHECNTLCTR